MDFKEFMRGALCKPEDGDTVEYFNLKGRVSCNILVNAQRNIPSPTYTYEPDITRFLEVYEEIKKDCDYHLSFNAIMMRALVEGLKAAPRLNAHIQYNHMATSGRLIIKKHIDVAMPVFLESGETFTVKVRAIEDKSLKEITEQTDDILRRLKKTNIDSLLFELIKQRMVGFVLKGQIPSTIAQVVSGYCGKGKVTKIEDLFKKEERDPESLDALDMNEGTVCMTNWGALNGDLTGRVTYTPLLYPQVFLMAIGNIREREVPVKNDDGTIDVAIKKELPLSLVFDHRIGGLADVVPFIERLDEIFKNPEVMKEW